VEDFLPMISKTLGHYQVGEQLGRGGMGEVYVATDAILAKDSWLRGASIRINQPFAYSPQSRPLVWVGVAFPNGRYFETAIPL
jgi:hypothetical protein